MKIFEGNLSAEGKRFGIVASRFNEFLTKNLLDGAIDCLRRHGTKDQDIDVVWVPGSFEIGFAARKMSTMKKYDAIICLGVILRGATPHFEYVAGQVTRLLGQINSEGIVPVVYGIIIADNIEQATERAGTKMGNKGWSAALSAIEMANINQILK
ncbi:MAG TPA: 6,7-dimethyl-8-ribityllumazine synthase [Candidatus Ratteibacteria bacterium]|jgi:6,7-dimethyl-8-ribityllumazine synthase|nr:6,7-dimethyl-8-ribityllumazine synthase [bacterium]HOQ81714.1 6,7-dimethyl-8-ribityllumazine synthase [bacterium]HRS06097.1 6,7-dimethyl-8-ribityllumazine synthase [Candidatus Ratteibacteria bacterium]HRV04080.1 6,7-dimethyl-8-ribityllumazine synthase [Candidatus Ratteibacteria bacterium]